jgi:uncharacterized membrane protein
VGDAWTGEARTDEILAEAQRRLEAREDPAVTRKREHVRRLNRGVYWLSQHWVALFNVLIGLYVSGAILAPVFMHWGRAGIANALYAFYKPFCHQYPFRSWFLFGPSFIRPLHEPLSILEMNQLGAFAGNAQIGYKMALCERDIAIYAMMVVAGLAYGAFKKRVRIPPLALWLYFLLGVMPMMLDGGVQWLSYALWQFFPGLLEQPFETIPLLRALTGSLFGLGVIAVGYPYMNEYFEDVQETLEAKYAWQA